VASEVSKAAGKLVDLIFNVVVCESVTTGMWGLDVGHEGS
jgi:hypothetical protein